MKKQKFSDFARNQIIKYLILILLIISIIFSAIMYFYVEKEAEKKLQIENQTITKILETNFNYLEDEIMRIELTDIGDKGSEERLLREFYEIRADSEVKFNFTFLREDEIVITNLYDMNADILLQGPNLIQGLNHIDKYNDVYFKANQNNYSENQKVATFAMRKFKNGYIIIEFLEESFENLKKIYSTNLIISDEFDNIIYQDTTRYQDEIGKVVTDVKDHIQQTSEINGFGRKINVLNLSDTSFNQQILLFGYALIFFISIVFILTIPFLSKKIAKSINEPLLHLLDVIETNQKGKLDYSADLTSLYEFNLLIKKYNLLLSSIQSLIESNNELAERKKWMEIKVLQNQFNPHFIYNTLESIRYEILLNPENASNMILRLSQIMRYSIKDYKKTVYLHEDIKYIEDYLTLQKMRFGERLEYDIQLSESLLTLKTPKLLIQPLVENSIKYNMDVVDQLKITIKAETLPSAHLVTVHDNGIGMSEKKLDELNYSLNNKDYVNKNYGLINVHRSIQILYGEEYGIKEINSTNGMKIKIYLPKESLDV